MKKNELCVAVLVVPVAILLWMAIQAAFQDSLYDDAPIAIETHSLQKLASLPQ